MSSAGCPKTLFAVCSIITTCITIFLIYYDSDMKLMTCGHCSECPVKAGTQGTNTTPATDVQNVQVDTTPVTIVLIWAWPFGLHHDLSCQAYNVKGCKVTRDRSLYHKAHGVIFHHWNIGKKIATQPRPWFQKWIWYNMEPPKNLRKIPELDNVFNVTLSYRLDSTIHIPYGYLDSLPSEVATFQLPAKNKLVCWIVSNYEPSVRVNYFNELKKHIKISTYGRAFGRYLADYIGVVSSCKFYLSFENSVTKDYCSEKLFRPMVYGAVPVVLGPPRETYERRVPPDSFIHVDDFATPKDLAHRLLHLDQNNDEYLRYFEWRKRFQARKVRFGTEAACKACAHLQINKGYETVSDLIAWFWV